MRNVSALIAGVVFGTGLTVSEMINPRKVLAFLDVTGNWDPSLAFVMGGAVIATFIGYRLVLRRPVPLLDDSFHVPTNRQIDGRLIGGALLFGVGWGMVGLCPGPAVAALAIGGLPALAFVVSMLAGMALYTLVPRR